MVPILCPLYFTYGTPYGAPLLLPYGTSMVPILWPLWYLFGTLMQLLLCPCYVGSYDVPPLFHFGSAIVFFIPLLSTYGPYGAPFTPLCSPSYAYL